MVADKVSQRHLSRQRLRSEASHRSNNATGTSRAGAKETSSQRKVRYPDVESGEFPHAPNGSHATYCFFNSIGLSEFYGTYTSRDSSRKIDYPGHREARDTEMNERVYLLRFLSPRYSISGNSPSARHTCLVSVGSGVGFSRGKVLSINVAIVKPSSKT